MHPAPRQPDGEGLQTPASAAWDMRQTPVVAWRSHFSKALGLVNVGDDVLLDPSGLRSLGVLESPYLTLDRVPVCLSGVDNVWCVKLCVLLPVCLQGVSPLCGTAWLWNKRSKCPSARFHEPDTACPARGWLHMPHGSDLPKPACGPGQEPSVPVSRLRVAGVGCVPFISKAAS